MKESYTHVTVILDRTGSMESIRDDIIGGFNTFLKDQQNETGDATLTLVQFDTYNPYEVIHKFKSILDVPKLTQETYIPRAGTPLLDAMGQGIIDLDTSLNIMSDESRPEHVAMVFITDGQENSSREYKMEDIEKMVNEKQEIDGWKMVFLSADMNAIKEARDLGFTYDSSMAFDKNTNGASSAWSSVSEKFSDLRSRRSRDIIFDENDRAYQEVEKNSSE